MAFFEAFGPISRREDTEVICIEAEEEIQFRIGIFQSFWAFICLDAKKRDFMHHRGDNEREVRTFGFYELACVIDMRRRCKIDL